MTCAMFINVERHIRRNSLAFSVRKGRSHDFCSHQPLVAGAEIRPKKEQESWVFALLFLFMFWCFSRWMFTRYFWFGNSWNSSMVREDLKKYFFMITVCCGDFQLWEVSSCPSVSRTKWISSNYSYAETIAIFHSKCDFFSHLKLIGERTKKLISHRKSSPWVSKK